ncbi:hypothetical protein [Desulfuribacillus alkaliarsenatis]|uniref:Uncharacterized protein n=1 Tax=Desulfuribacillus alkaliarsenatis TaxID=766136 RepID=A0A1E5G3R1_9FIRM|nr:hypothetical protein [Desulfuribacillus alkaliarsenatis]OEF97696.1 hypothetical protein BHF68_13945 [Desulfuribacillus alkaliarsenatis]
MKLEKKIYLVFILTLTAIIMVACSLFPPKVSEPTVGDVPPITEENVVPKTPHAVDGPFANCITCHAAAEARHTMWDDEYCLSCHPPADDAGAGVGFGAITLPTNHDSPAFANCAMCHANDAVGASIPHALDGDYADCASCHEINYEEAAEGENGDSAGGLAAVTLPANHDSPAFANCAMCHANDAVGASIPHALDGVYADCASCHDINFQAAAPVEPAPAPSEPAQEQPAQEQPAQEQPASGGLGAITLPAGHNSPAFANCAMCHANDAVGASIPHALDGAYADCASCHQINYN